MSAKNEIVAFKKRVATVAKVKRHLEVFRNNSENFCKNNALKDHSLLIKK